MTERTFDELARLQSPRDAERAEALARSMCRAAQRGELQAGPGRIDQKITTLPLLDFVSWLASMSPPVPASARIRELLRQDTQAPARPRGPGSIDDQLRLELSWKAWGAE